MSDESTETEDSVFSDGPACFRNKFSGLYKTFSKGDFAFPVTEWQFVHKGSCQCEGKTGDDCQEPGDDG